MKYLLKYNESRFIFNGDSEYSIYISEINRYIEYFKNFFAAIVQQNPVSLEEFNENGKGVGCYLNNNGSNQTGVSILINIKNFKLLIHIYYSDNNRNITDKSILLSQIIKVTSLFDMLKESEERNFEVSLKICADSDKTTKVKLGNDQPSILFNLLKDDRYIKPYDNSWFNILPYFIHFGDSTSIKNWWYRLFLDKNPNQIYKVINKIGANEKEFNKFKQITGYDPANLDSASDMGEMGF